LIVVAHPCRDGFSILLGQAYARAAQEAGHTVRVLDLYREKQQLPFFTFDRDAATCALIKTYQAEITWANHIVFSHPLWWGSMPGILKNWLDHTIESRFAYQYEKHPWLPKWLTLLPKPLLKGKTTDVYITCDSPGWALLLTGLPFFVVWYIYICVFCGLRVRHTLLCDRMHWVNASRRAQWLAQVAKWAS
jgi:putative NADPH-quinone reductase